MTRGARWVEKKEFRLVRIDAKSNASKPFATKRGNSLELGYHAGKGFTGCKNAAIIYVKREIGVPRAPEAKLKKRGGKDRGKNGGERGTLRGTANWSK